MQRVLPFIFLIVVLTSGVAVAAKALDRNIIMADWKNRRCDTASIFLAPLFKSPDDSRSYMEFAVDNFDFCMKSLQTAAVDSAMQPLYSTAKAQLGATETIAGTMNNLRATLSNIMSSTRDTVLVSFYDEFKRYIAAISLTMQRIRMAANRISASTQAMLYMAISTIRGILNAIDFILLVAIIVLTILAILFIIFFFVLFPSVPLILAVIAALVGAGIGQVAELRDTFCFAPHTLVKLADGSVIPIARIELGDMLWGGAKLTGMYVFNGSSSQMFGLRGVHVAGDHIVRRDDGTWGYVKDHPDAEKIGATYMRVYCPIVDGRELTVSCATGEMVFKDWEEVADDVAEREWERWAWKYLNPGVEYEPTNCTGEMAQGFNPATTVMVYGKGATSIADVKIGDLVFDIGGDGHGEQYTKVLGVYEGICPAPLAWSSNWVRSAADGVWRRELRPISDCRLRHLVTESGTFYINGMLVRDATEVGNRAIAESYDTVMNLLNSYT
jgi:hypothetical protein